MTAIAGREIHELLDVLRDAWAERQAVSAVGALESARRHPDWESALQEARSYAEEAFELVFVGGTEGRPLAPLFQQLRERLAVFQQRQKTP
jgi:hypothetical protein